MAPITAPEVSAWTGGAVPADDENLGAVVAAVNSWVSSLPVSLDESASDRVRLGSTILAAKVIRRRNSPNGVETITGEGVAYVARYDPEVSRFLGLDAPAVG